MRHALEQPLCPAEPSGRARRLAAQGGIEAEPEGAAHGANRLGGIEVRMMSALEVVRPLVVASEHVCRRGEQLELLGSQRRRPIGARQRLVCVAPFAP
jgi:hypothetical protein